MHTAHGSSLLKLIHKKCLHITRNKFSCRFINNNSNNNGNNSSIGDNSGKTNWIDNENNRDLEVLIYPNPKVRYCKYLCIYI